MDLQPAGNPPQQWWRVLLFFLLLLILYLLFTNRSPGETTYSIPYNEFKQRVAADQVAKVALENYALRGELHQPKKIGPDGELGKHFQTAVPLFGDDELLPLLEKHKVELKITDTQNGSWWPLLLLSVPWLLLLVFYFWMINRASRSLGRGLGGGLGGQGELKRFLAPERKPAQIPKQTFADVAGQENAKREVAELVDYLRRPDFYTRLGAEVPRGVLLMGPPGTGKTLMAKALAGEAGVPFFNISGSEFIEVFVGVGAARVRHLFQSAKAEAPSIVFIDELDSVGRTRGTGLGGGHDEREQTLNQILAEMDGFTGHEAVIVLAATNRPDVLDPALLRPGRFDRHVTLDLPDRKDRVAILQVHLRKVPVAPDVDLEQLASGTPGFSGADLKNLVNEAAMTAARENRDQVMMTHFEEARDKLLLGGVRTLAIQPEERHRLAVHEAGHTLVAFFMPHTDPLYKVTIIPRGHSLGGTQQLPEEERHTLPEEYLRDRLAVMLGGRAAEKLLLGTVSSGADDDIRQATNLARAMVSRWGMSEEIGPVDLRQSEEHPFLGREIAQPRHFSESSARAVDKAVRTLLAHAEERAGKIIEQQGEAMGRLIATLEEKETLHREEIEACLSTGNVS